MRFALHVQISCFCLGLATFWGCEEAHQDAAALAADGGELADAGSDPGSGGSGGSDEPAAGGGSEAGAGSGGAASGRGGAEAGPGRGGRGGAGAGAGRGGSSAGSGGTPAAGGSGSGSAAGSGSARRCGTRGGAMCSPEQFCNHEPDADCGATDRGGVCEAKPQICTAIYAPVCGCDDRTYGNACEAHGAGVSVKGEGMCMTAGGGGGKTCGGFAGLSCDGEQFCNYEPAAGGQGCDGIADAAGVCEPTPRACTRDYRPVCSCDRRSFSNRCSAHAEGASVLHEGACTEVDCKALGGRVAYGTGPAAMCAQGETEHTWVTNADGSMPIEGAVCCLP